MDVSASSRLSNNNNINTNTRAPAAAPDSHINTAHSLNRYNNGVHTPVSNTSHLRFSSTTSRNGSLHEGSRSSSKLSLNEVAHKKQHSQIQQQQQESSDDEEDETGDEEDHRQVTNKSLVIASSGSSNSSGNSNNGDGDSSQDNDSTSGLLTSGDEDGESDYESVPWSEGSEFEDEEPGCDLFVACAWNGVTYLIDWSKKLDNDTNEDLIKYQLVKFAFEGRVCAFTAGLYCVENHVNVPCLFYVDFEDQIYVYYDVRISPGPVTGFIDAIDDDIEEALDRIMDIEAQLKKKSGPPASKYTSNSEDGTRIDLGDGWEGIAGGGEDDEDDMIGDATTTAKNDDSDPLSKGS